MAIRMRESKNKEASCCECGITYKNSRALFEIQVGNERLTICKHCEETLFSKLLLLDCKFSARTKSNEDIKRANNDAVWREKHERK